MRRNNMRSKSACESLSYLLRYLVLGLLIITTLLYLFVFLINWEDWVFGVKLDGLPAGLALLARALSAGVLAGLFWKYPRHVRAVAALTVLYFGFLFADSAVTIQILTGGRSLFSPVLGLLLSIPVMFLVIDMVVVHCGKVRVDT
jgi:hypothetical protein